MQPYFNLISEDQSSSNLDPYQSIPQKISTTSTASSCASPYYAYMDTGKCGREKMDANFIIRFNSLNLDNKKEQSSVTEIHRHTSGLPFRPSHPIYPKLSQRIQAYEPPQLTCSTKEASSNIPTAYRSAMNKNASPFVPHSNAFATRSTTNLSQVVSTLPFYPVPQYYGFQPEMVPVQMFYGYYNYPSRPIQKKYTSSKNQIPSLLSEQTNVSAELTEKTIILMKEYESSGDYKKLEGEVSGMVKVQSGSRFLQQELDKSDPKFFNFILQEVLSSFIQLGQ